MAGSGLTLLVGGAGVDGVDDRGGVERRVGVEDDRRLLVDGRAGGQAGLGLDGVLDVAVADRQLLVLGVEEAVEDAGRGLAGERVERGEGDGQAGRSATLKSSATCTLSDEPSEFW